MSDQISVSIGLPVYNGGNFLHETIDSLINQTYSSFEVIISDNASNDETEEICRHYAAIDSRIIYIRQQENLGAARNHNFVFEISRGKYFKWQGHDDPLAESFLERCVAVLDRKPEIILCFARPRAVDENGRDTVVSPLTRGHFAMKPRVGAGAAHLRFFDVVVAGHPAGAIYGLVRREVLAATPLIGSYRWSDLALLGELALRGRFEQLPEPLQSIRYHPQKGRSVHASHHEREAWYDPRGARSRSRPYATLLTNYIESIDRAAPDRGTRMVCRMYMALWVAKYAIVQNALKRLLRRPYLSVRGAFNRLTTANSRS
jgi:glycosyltransferase involved in cell wall biosynthesis